jgi:hypothetical protein
MNITYKVVDMPIDNFTKRFWEAKAGLPFDFQDKILLETNNPYALEDYDENLTVLVYIDENTSSEDMDWFTVKDVVTDAESYRDFLAIPFN